MNAHVECIKMYSLFRNVVLFSEIRTEVSGIVQRTELQCTYRSMAIYDAIMYTTDNMPTLDRSALGSLIVVTMATIHTDASSTLISRVSPSPCPKQYRWWMLQGETGSAPCVSNLEDNTGTLFCIYSIFFCTKRKRSDKSKWHHKGIIEKFDYTAIADRLRMVNCNVSNYGHRTEIVTGLRCQPSLSPQQACNQNHIL